MLRTSDAAETRCGLAHVRRRVDGERVRVLHVVFAPAIPRPLLLGLVRAWNLGAEARVVDYTEMWQVGSGVYRTAPGAGELATPAGRRALADVSSAIRARAPEAPPTGGLALSVRFGIPAGSVRELAFAYVAPDPGEDPAVLIRAFRGHVRAELARAVRSLASVVDPADPVSDYRRRAATLAACGR